MLCCRPRVGEQCQSVRPANKGRRVRERPDGRNTSAESTNLSACALINVAEVLKEGIYRCECFGCIAFDDRCLDDCAKGEDVVWVESQHDAGGGRGGVP